MTNEEYIRQQVSAGYDIHLSRGVWWQKVSPFFHKPVCHLQSIDPGQSAPDALKSFLGYSHVVPGAGASNRLWPVLALENEKLRAFSLQGLSSSKRSQVRKGLRLVQIRRIEDIGAIMEDLRDICISTAQRTGSGRPPEYYVKNAAQWRAWITREFALPKREWWGAYHGDRLVAYLYSCLIDGTMFIYAAKSHSDSLDRCPNDALIVSFLGYCRELSDCHGVIFGDWTPDVPSLNDFKRQFGFEKNDLPVYAKYNKAVVPVQKLMRVLARARAGRRA